VPRSRTDRRPRAERAVRGCRCYIFGDLFADSRPALTQCVVRLYGPERGSLRSDEGTPMDDPRRESPVAEKQPSMAGASADSYRRVRTAYLVGAVVLIAAYPFSPTWAQQAIKLAASLATLPALAVGTRRISRDRRAPWILLLAALTLINIANVVGLFPGAPATIGSDLIEAAGDFVVLFAALELIRQQNRANVGSIIDTSIAALALGGLLWALVLEPNLTPSSQQPAARLALFIGVFALAGVLGALAQMIIQRPVPALRPLVLAWGLALVGDVILAVTTDHALSTAASMMTIAAHAALGLFGLDPTAGQLATPAPARPDRLSRSRLIFLGLAVAALPIVIGAEQVEGHVMHPFLLVVSAASITTLVMLRIGRVSTQRDRAEAALRHEATHDPLTGLANRKEFTRQVSRELTRGRTVAVIFCDLNRFKAINDRFGHAVGDQVLVEVAHRLRTTLDANDLVSRLGGDEFVILLRNTTAVEVQAVNRRIVNTIDIPILISDQCASIGVTTGTAFADKDDADPDDLIERADHAMYLAKTNEKPRQTPELRIPLTDVRT
jgi:diguanylate cyclase